MGVVTLWLPYSAGDPLGSRWKGRRLVALVRGRRHRG